MVFLLHDIHDQLFIPRFKNMQVQVFTGIHHNTKRKYGNEIGHNYRISITDKFVPSSEQGTGRTANDELLLLRYSLFSVHLLDIPQFFQSCIFQKSITGRHPCTNISLLCHPENPVLKYNIEKSETRRKRSLKPAGFLSLPVIFFCIQHGIPDHLCPLVIHSFMVWCRIYPFQLFYYCPSRGINSSSCTGASSHFTFLRLNKRICLVAPPFTIFQMFVPRNF